MSDYRIDELAEQAANALVATGTVPPSARVSALPDRRMLRYYTTIGLLDRPVEIRGRTAYYGRRHLLQIVAIKRLQSTGASLAEIQQRLAGASTADLESIAALPDQASAPNGAAPARRDFWRADPAFPTSSPEDRGALTGMPPAASAPGGPGSGPAAPGGPAAAASTPASAPAAPGGPAASSLGRATRAASSTLAAAPGSAAPGTPAAPAASSTLAAALVVPVPTAIRLAPGVTLVIDAARPLAAAEHDDLRAAAGPLLDHLTTRGLLAAEPQER